MSEENMNNTAVEHEYGADQIQILEGLEAVRKRPGMYIGTTSSRGLHHLVYEIVDNAVDEALAGVCDTIDVTINEDNSITVIDNGRGIPVGINHKAGIPAVEVVFTILHAGGKFGGGGYKVSGGLHGVGASVVNALSNWLEVEICQGGKVYKQRYERGHVCYALKEIGSCPMEKTGTKVTFLPDDTIFTETTIYDFDVLKRRLREMAFLTKGLRIILRDNRTEEEASLEAMSAEHENEQISELLQRAQEDAKDTSASSDDPVSDAAAKESVKDDSEAFADAFAISEESTKARTGGKIGKIHTITLENGKKQKVVEFYYEGGIKEFVAYLNKSKEPLYENILYFEGEKNNVYVEVSFQHNDSYNESVFSFVNNINTPEGGTHLQGFRNAITKTFNDYARSAKLLKDSEPNLSGEDIREGLTAIVSVKIEDPQFEGQTKQKLGNSEARAAVDNIVSEQLTYFLEQNPQIAKTICEKSILAQRAREAARKSFVLLKNEEQILPLDKTKKTAFIGPYVNSRNLMGSWSIIGEAKDITTVEETMAVEEAGNNVVCCQGSPMLGAEVILEGFTEENQATYTPEEEAKMLEEAIRERLNPAKIVVMDTAGVSSMYANDGGVIVAV